jgi:hypothetical protein
MLTCADGTSGIVGTATHAESSDVMAAGSVVVATMDSPEFTQHREVLTQMATCRDPRCDQKEPQKPECGLLRPFTFDVVAVSLTLPNPG